MLPRAWLGRSSKLKLLRQTSATATTTGMCSVVRTPVSSLMSSSPLTGVVQRSSLSSSSAASFDYDSASSLSSSYGHQHHQTTHQVPPLTNCELDTSSDGFRQAMERTRSQVQDLENHLDQVSQGGGSSAVQRHLERNKLLPRDRIRQLVDPGTPVLELSALAGLEQKVPSGGIVTAIGVVSGRRCMMIANDATVKGGTVS